MIREIKLWAFTVFMRIAIKFLPQDAIDTWVWLSEMPIEGIDKSDILNITIITSKGEPSEKEMQKEAKQVNDMTYPLLKTTPNSIKSNN